MTMPHPLDLALQLQPVSPGQCEGLTSPDYWNMVGPFGGITAAVLVKAVMEHPARLGEPLSLTVNFAGALTSGAFTLQVTPVRTNRSTQHWTLSILQTDAEGDLVVTTTATMVTAVRRETWSVSDEPMPQVATPGDLQRIDPGLDVEWLKRYEMRLVQGGLPQDWDGAPSPSLSQLWMRDDPPRPLDFCALAALADVFFPRVWLRRARQVPAGTVSITVYFHASQAQMQTTGTGYVLGQARGQEFRNGFFDQTAQLWNEAGYLLATSHQIVYFKE